MLRTLAALLVCTIGGAQSGVGSMFSGVTDGDGTSAYWNPAAMSLVSGTQIDGGFALSLIRLSFHPQGSVEQSNSLIPKPEPTGGIVTDLAGSWLRMGVAFGVPYVDGAGWPRDGDASEITRYYMVKSRMYHITITPAVSFRATRWLSLGSGIDIVRSRMEGELDRDFGQQFNLAAKSPSTGVPFPLGDPALAGAVNLASTGWTVGWVAGVLVRPLSRLSLGATFHAATTADSYGTVRIAYPGGVKKVVEKALPAAELPALRGKFHSPLTLPLTALFAAAYTPWPRWELRADYKYLMRSQTSRVDIRITEATSPDLKSDSSILTYRDRHNIGARLTHDFHWGLHQMRAALSVRYEPNTVPEEVFSPTHMDYDKWELGGALKAELAGGLFAVAEYSHFFVDSMTVDESVHRPLAEPSLTAYAHPAPYGRYDAVADRFAVGLSWTL